MPSFFMESIPEPVVHSKVSDAAKAQWVVRHANKRKLVEQANAAQELLRRRENSKISFYRPCCRVHGETMCPTFQCRESVHVAFHRSPARIRTVFGGNRSGKTIAGLTEMVMRTCLKKHPFTGVLNRFPSHNRIFCSDFAVIEKLILPQLYEWIPKESLKYGAAATKQEAWEKSYDPRFHILELCKGSTIDFMSYDQDTSKAESVELDNVWADEEMPERLYAATLARMVSRNGNFWMTVTPLYSLTWAMGFMEKEDPNVETFVFQIFDNPHLSPEAIQLFIQSIPEGEKEARIYGRFLELQGLVYKELRKDVHWIESSSPFDSENPEKKYPVTMTLDPHPRKASDITWAFTSPTDDIVFFDELEMKGTAHEIALAIQEKEALHGAPTTLRLIDPAAKGQGSNLAFQTDTLHEFEKEGLSFTLADNSDAGYNVVHEYLQWDQLQEMSSLNRPRCYFTKDAPKTWHGMTHLVWDEYRFGRDLRDPKERVKDYKKDFPDCVRYTLASRPAFKANTEPMALGNLVHTSPKYRERPVRDFILGRT